MTVRVVLTLKSNDITDSVQQVLFALRETWGETFAADTVLHIEARRP